LTVSLYLKTPPTRGPAGKKRKETEDFARKTRGRPPSNAGEVPAGPIR
jgi:hypothetical protein